MAVLWKETAPPDSDGDAPTGTDPFAAPFDVITYAGPITMAGYERLSHLLETGKTHERALLVLETPGGDPHAAFRIARAIGFHYGGFHVLVPRYCKSAGTLIVAGAAVLHMSDVAELGPLDMQVPRLDAINQHSSALEYSGVLNALRPQQLAAFVRVLQDLADEGLSADSSCYAAAELVSGLFRPICEQVNPYRLVEMQRAMAIASAYGERLAAIGRNVDAAGIRRLALDYPSHAFVIDRREARRLFHDVRAPVDAVLDVAQSCGPRVLNAVHLDVPIVELRTFSFPTSEDPHAQETSAARHHSGQQTHRSGSHPHAVRRSVRSGPKADLGVAGSGGVAPDAATPQRPPEAH